jgi:hypothetical protein
LGPQGVRERVKGVTLLPEMAELGTHLVECAIFVAGSVLELLPPTDQNQKVSHREEQARKRRNRRK